jgi:hypothetical protein
MFQTTTTKKKNSISDVLILESSKVMIYFLLVKFSVAFFTSLGGLATYTHRN